MNSAYGKSDLITINNNELASLESELATVANRHQLDLQKYQARSSNFSQIFPPNPGNHCRYCPFNSICEFADVKLAKSDYMPIIKHHR